MKLPACCPAPRLPATCQGHCLITLLPCSCVDFVSLALKKLGPQLAPGLQVSVGAIPLPCPGSGFYIFGFCPPSVLTSFSSASTFFPMQVRALHGRMKQAAREATLASYTSLAAGEGERGRGMGMGRPAKVHTPPPPKPPPPTIIHLQSRPCTTPEALPAGCLPCTYLAARGLDIPPTLPEPPPLPPIC